MRKTALLLCLGFVSFSVNAHTSLTEQDNRSAWAKAQDRYVEPTLTEGPITYYKVTPEQAKSEGLWTTRKNIGESDEPPKEQKSLKNRSVAPIDDLMPVHEQSVE